MELSTLKSLLSDPGKLIGRVQSLRPVDQEEFEDIQPENHGVMKPSVRKKREVKYDTEEKDPITDQPIMKTVYEEVTRIPSPIEKNIVNWSVQMCAGIPIDPQAKPVGVDEEVIFEMVKHELTANKTDFKDKEILRLMGTYKRVAEVWYSEEAPEGYWGEIGTFPTKMRMMLLSYENGNILFPIFNDYGDFIALTREYVVLDEDDRETTMFDIFMIDQRITFKQNGATWDQASIVVNKYGKINVMYYQQDRTEYADIIPKRKRLETLQSDIGDQNLATGSPIIVASKLLGLGKRGETGKVFEVEDGGKLDILEAAGAPESIKFEWENLKKDIYADTQTPDMDMFNNDSLNGTLPIIGIKMRFLPATLKALSKQSGEFGMGIQRRYNFLKAACAVINPAVKGAAGLQITPKFGIYLPSNETEEYDNIVKLVGAGLMSKETAIIKLAFTDDPAGEYEKIKAEAEEAQKNAMAVAAASKAPAAEKPTSK
jgi:hypothetical protein